MTCGNKVGALTVITFSTNIRTGAIGTMPLSLIGIGTGAPEKALPWTVVVRPR